MRLLFGVVRTNHFVQLGWITAKAGKESSIEPAAGINPVRLQYGDLYCCPVSLSVFGVFCLATYWVIVTAWQFGSSPNSKV